MNKQRRKEIGEVLAEIAEFGSTIQSLIDEEQDAFDALPCSLQDSEKGDRMQTAIDALQEALDSLENTLASLNEAMEV